MPWYWHLSAPIAQALAVRGIAKRWWGWWVDGYVAAIVRWNASISIGIDGVPRPRLPNPGKPVRR
jgi:hypothetical protein